MKTSIVPVFFFYYEGTNERRTDRGRWMYRYINSYIEKEEEEEEDVVVVVGWFLNVLVNY